MKQKFYEMEKIMKTLLTLSLFAVLIFYGCDQQSDIITPVTGKDASQPIKIERDIDPDVVGNDEAMPLNTRITKYPTATDNAFLPTNLPPSDITGFSVSKVIDGQSGGFIELNFDFDDFIDDDDDDDGDDDDGLEDLVVNARLDIPANAFQGSQEITMVIDYEIAAIYFYPHMVFNTPVNLDVTYSDFEIEDDDIDPDEIDFVFQDEDGSIEHLDYASLVVDLEEEYIAVDDAQLHHFSRYGWVR
jgi:hypothetical protein